VGHKWKRGPRLSGNRIAQNLVAKMKRQAHGKVVNFGDVVTGRASAEELHRTVASKEDLAALHPAHAAYAYTQNQVSVMSEQLTALPEMAPFVEIISNAEELLMPSAPPMSPLTTSYFTCWALFDVCVGPAKETIGTTVLEVGAAFGMHSELLRLMRSMQDSRMGLYTHEGVEGDLVVLREIGTGAVCRAVVPSGYSGQNGELWYVRVLPPPMPGGAAHVVFTTPYIVLHPGLADWLAYFSRTFPKQQSVGDYERHMKYGPTPMYWPDYVFEAYVNHRADAIYLAGVPDIPESRPHSEGNQWGFKQ
jgi:hypothetical protein